MLLCDADFLFILLESPFCCSWTTPFPPSSRQLLSPLTYFMTGSWAEDWSFIPFIGTWTEAWTLPFPTTSRSQLVSSYSGFITGSFSCWWIFPIIAVWLYGLVIFEDKCHIWVIPYKSTKKNMTSSRWAFWGIVWALTSKFAHKDTVCEVISGHISSYFAHS